MTTRTKFRSDAFEAIHSAADIKRIREYAHVSQPVFARYLNTSESTVQKWEARAPSGRAGWR